MSEEHAAIKPKNKGGRPRKSKGPSQRRQQLDLFLMDLISASPKDDQHSMEHPLFSLSQDRDMAPFTYDYRGMSLRIAPSELGRATQKDKDILIYCGSQVAAAMNRNEGAAPPPSVALMTVHDFLKVTGRSTGADAYQVVQNALTRLQGTTITYNYKLVDAEGNPEKGVGGINLIQRWKVIEEGEHAGRIQIELASWHYEAIIKRSMLTLNHEYFELDSNLERRLYELARKHCGTKQEGWMIGLEALRTKCGYKADLKYFRRSIKKLAQILEYSLTYMDSNDSVVVTRL